MAKQEAPSRPYGDEIQPSWGEYVRESVWLGLCDPKQPWNVFATYQRDKPLVMPISLRNVIIGCGGLAAAGVVISRLEWSNGNMNTIGVVLVFLALVVFIMEAQARSAAKRYVRPQREVKALPVQDDELRFSRPVKIAVLSPRAQSLRHRQRVKAK